MRLKNPEVVMYRNILVPVSLDQDRNTKAALDVARGLLDEGGQITALHVDEPIPNFSTSYLPKGSEEERARAMQDDLDTKINHMPGIKTEIQFGGAGLKIVEYARDMDVDCIVIASHRPGLQDYFLGSTAARVVRHALCSVHVVR